MCNKNLALIPRRVNKKKKSPKPQQKGVFIIIYINCNRRVWFVVEKKKIRMFEDKQNHRFRV